MNTPYTIFMYPMTENPVFELTQLDEAKEWLFELRKHYSQNSDIWEMCRHWETVKQ